MRILSSLRIYRICGLTVILLAGLLFYCKPSSTSSQQGWEAAQEQPGNIERLWIKQKPARIAIPEDVGEKAELTRNFYFILDGSGSMSEPTNQDCGGDQQFNDKLEGAKWAVNKFLEHVPDNVNIGLYVYDNNGKGEVVPLGPANRKVFIAAVDKIESGGGTPLAQAIRFGADRLVQQFKKQLGYGEFRLVVVTDGKADDIPQAALYAAKYGIPIYAIGLCIGQDHPLRNFSVSYRAADNFADLSSGLQDTLAELPSFDTSRFEQKPR